MKIFTFDTTLRDGTQGEAVSFSVEDKLAIAQRLDDLGIDYIEGGWPGSNPKDKEFFARAREIKFQHAKLTAFGATRFAKHTVHTDPSIQALLASGTPVISIFGKSWKLHVERALGVDEETNLKLIGETVKHLKDHGREVVYDAEHFFDGYKASPDFALRTLEAAKNAGANVLCLCDTNGGTIPMQLVEIVAEVRKRFDGILGIHPHNDSDVAVANTLAAVEAGVTHVQGCINGYGERTGNADLLTVVSNLQIKQGHMVLPQHGLREATRIAHAVSEVTNVPPYRRQPYVGASAFAHKAGLHASAIKVDPDLYQHTDPTAVGNDMRMLVSDMAGRASIELKGRELGYDLSQEPELLSRVVAKVKELELAGYTFDAADASFELLLHAEVTGDRLSYFGVESWRVITDSLGQGRAMSEATVKLTAGGQRVVATGEGNGPVNALDHALRQALSSAYPELDKLELIDFRVRILDAAHGTDAVTRVLIETSDGTTSWDTVGVAPNIVEASWIALVDGITYGLRRKSVPVR